MQFSDAQWARLQAAFPGGVCDWSKPGVGATQAVPWLTFTAGPAVPGGKPLGAAPVSSPVTAGTLSSSLATAVH